MQQKGNQLKKYATNQQILTLRNICD
jgi:hypothetical protein